MKKTKNNSTNLKIAQTKIEEVISKQVDKTIDKIVDKTFDEIKQEETKQKRKKSAKQETKVTKFETEETKQQKKFETKENKKKDERIVYGLSYFLFFISLVFSKSEERKFYANQGLVLLLFTIVGAVFFKFVIGLLHYETSIISSLIFYVFVLLFATYGLVKTLMGEKQTEIPLIGRIKLIK